MRVACLALILGLLYYLRGLAQAQAELAEVRVQTQAWLAQTQKAIVGTWEQEEEGQRVVIEFAEGGRFSFNRPGWISGWYQIRGDGKVEIWAWEQDLHRRYDWRPVWVFKILAVGDGLSITEPEHTYGFTKSPSPGARILTLKRKN
jgi:hypothetical protein